MSESFLILVAPNDRNDLGGYLVLVDHVGRTASLPAEEGKMILQAELGTARAAWQPSVGSAINFALMSLNLMIKDGKIVPLSEP